MSFNNNVSVVILANSIKHGNNCVAGKCLNTKKWIRFVANDSGKELSLQQSKVSNPYGSYPVKPLQKVEIGLSKNAPLINQPENYVIDGSEWKQRFKVNKSDLQELLDHPQSLWGPGNKVECQQIKSGSKRIEQSLYLVKVEKLQLYTNSFGKRRAHFDYNDQHYDLPVTDRNFDDMVSNENNLEGILCLSLGEPFDGYCYKIVAGIY